MDETKQDQEIKFNPATHDIYVYAGEINTSGYEMLSNLAGNPANKYALLILFTPGGDPHAGFRIARALQCYYNHFDILLPRICKSAGSLITIGAKSIYMDDMSELGPLDVQLKKKDEIFGLTSGLDIAHTLNHLQNQAMSSFRNSLLELSGQAGLSTKMAADIASNLTSGLFQPIMAQVDPMKLSETQRALEIAQAYGTRLNEKPLNLRAGGLEALITGYPSHGFVIDRKEAKRLFVRVSKPEGILREYSDAFRSAFQQETYKSLPTVIRIPAEDRGQQDDQTPPDSTRTQAGNDESKPKESGIIDQAPAQLQSNTSATRKPGKKP
jgi:hypothetical protein